MRIEMRWGGLLLAGAFAMTALGCPKDKTPDTAAPTEGGSMSSGPAGAAKRYKIAVIPKGTANSFWQTVKAGADQAGKDLGADTPFQGPAKEGDFTDQIEVVQDQVNNHADAIVLAACDSNALIQCAKDATAKGIPVVTVDSGLADPSASVAYIATDNVKAGAAAADSLADVLGKKGNVGFLPFLKGAASSDEREKGFVTEIAKYPDIHIVSTLYTNSDVSKAVDMTTNMLTAHGDIVGIFAANEPNGVAAAQVLKTLQKNGKIHLVAFDASKPELEALKDGTIDSLIVQDPFQMGYLGVQTAIKAIKKEPITDRNVDSGFTVVTKANLNDSKVQKLLK